MLNKNHILIEVTENQITDIVQSQHFETLLEKAIQNAKNHISKTSESEIEDWDIEFNNFNKNKPTSNYEYVDNTGDIGYVYSPDEQRFEFWYHKKDTIDIYIKTLET